MEQTIFFVIGKGENSVEYCESFPTLAAAMESAQDTYGDGEKIIRYRLDGEGELAPPTVIWNDQKKGKKK